MDTKLEERANYSQLNIYQKMLLAMEKINTVSKNLVVGEGKNQYKAVGEVDVLNAVKPIEVELGIYSYPFSREIIEAGRYTSKTSYGEKDNFMIRIQTIYRFVNINKPDEYVDITTYGDGYDSQDKAPGKAMTYGDKYALLKAYKIATGDDPDKEPSPEDVKYKKNENQELKQGEEPINKAKKDRLVTDIEAKRIYALLKANNLEDNVIVDILMKKYNVENTSKLMVSQVNELAKEFKI